MNRLVAVSNLLLCTFSYHYLALNQAAAEVRFEWKTIGELGNASMSTVANGAVDVVQDLGDVDYEYAVAKHEVSVSQYVEFLNTVVRIGDPHGLYNKDADLNGGYITRTGKGITSDPYIYSARPGKEGLPVNFVGWRDAARFVNWLANGQRRGGTESGSYDMSQIPPTRTPGATVFLPSPDEWHKAAYYDPRTEEEGGPKQIPHYWRFPQQSDSKPTQAIIDSMGEITNPVAHVANWGQNFLTSLTPHAKVDSGGPGTESYFGIMHMGGNLVEWTEGQNSTANPTNRDIRGGDWGNGDWDQWNTNVNTAKFDHESSDNGIRVFALPAFANDPTGGILPPVLSNDTPIGEPFTSDAETVVLYHFDGDWNDSSPNALHLTPTGNTQFGTEVSWMWSPSGSSAYFPDTSDTLTVNVPDDLVMPAEGSTLTIDWLQLIDGIVVQNPAETDAPGEAYFEFEQGFDARFQVRTSQHAEPYGPSFRANNNEVVDNDQTYFFTHDNFSPIWNRMRMTLDADGMVRCYVNGLLMTSVDENGAVIEAVSAPPRYERGGDWVLIIGGFKGWIDEFRISNSIRDERDGSDPVGFRYAPYLDWAGEEFSSLPEGAAAPEAQPASNVDADEGTNIFEFLSGTNPMDGSETIIPGGDLKEADGVTVLEFSYRRRKGGTQGTTTLYSVGELTCHLETAASLAEPSSWAEEPARWTQLDNVVDHLDGTETVTFQTPIAADTTLFARLRVVYTPPQS